MSHPRLYFDLNRAQQNLRKLVDRIAVADIGVSSVQLAVLFLVREKDRTPLEIATALNLDQSAVTGLMRRMLRSELIEQHPNPDDGRSRLVTLSDRGRSVTAHTADLLPSFNEALAGGFSKGEIEVIDRFLNRVAELTEEDLRS